MARSPRRRPAQRRGDLQPTALSLTLGRSGVCWYPVPKLRKVSSRLDRSRSSQRKAQFKASFELDIDFENEEIDFEKNVGNLEEAECREERRWMEQENARIARRFKKAETERVQGLVSGSCAAADSWRKLGCRCLPFGRVFGTMVFQNSTHSARFGRARRLRCAALRCGVTPPARTRSWPCPIGSNCFDKIVSAFWHHLVRFRLYRPRFLQLNSSKY